MLSRGLLHGYSCARIKAARCAELVASRIMSAGKPFFLELTPSVTDDCLCISSITGNHDSDSSFLASCLGPSRYQRSICELQSWQKMSTN
jgi:DNA-binding PucR family transcriptional regulator